jgi:hypothetical protein
MAGMPEPLYVTGVIYHGGFSFLAVAGPRMGRLVLDDDAVTLDKIPHETLTQNFDPPIELCRTRAIATVEVTSEQVAASKPFGLWSVANSKSSVDRATVLVYLKNGDAGYFTVDKHSTASLLGILAPWLREHSIALGAPDAAIAQLPIAPKLIADELLKLAQMRDTGVLSEEEFVTLKTQLIQHHTGTTAH